MNLESMEELYGKLENLHRLALEVLPDLKALADETDMMKKQQDNPDQALKFIVGSVALRRAYKGLKQFARYTGGAE